MREETLEQVRQDIDVWFRWSSTLIGGLIIIASVWAISLHFFDKVNYPSPADMETPFLLAMGFVLILLTNFPWAKIRVGDIEIERAVQEQIEDYSAEIEKLEKTIDDLEQELAKKEDFSKQPSKKVEEIQAKKSESENDKKILLEFLNKWSSWGFTASRISNWGGNQAKFERLKELSTFEIKSIASKLIIQKEVKTRISKNGNILYQKA